MRSRLCARLNDDGTVDKVYESTRAAARDNGLVYAAIYESCRFGWRSGGHDFRYLDGDGRPVPPGEEGFPSRPMRKFLESVSTHFVPLLGQEAWDISLGRLRKAVGQRRLTCRCALDVMERLLAEWYVRQTDVFMISTDWIRARELAEGCIPQRRR